MSYMRTNPANIPPSAVHAARRDQKYFREILSPGVRRLYEAIDEVLDPMEYEGSLLFDEYPDTGEITRLAEQVLRGAEDLPTSDFYAKGQEELPVSDFGAQEREDLPASDFDAEDRGDPPVFHFDARERHGFSVPGFDARGVGSVRERDLAKALLCEEMCRRRFRHLMLSISK